MEHHFNTEVAARYGVNVAIFLHNIAFWTLRNIGNKKHFYDNRFWTYNSQKALTILFPYWTRQNIRTILNKCIKEKLIVVGNYNENKYDQTSWYALTDTGISLFPELDKALSAIGWNQPIEELEAATSLVGINQPIPDSNTDTKPDKKQKAFTKDQKTNKQKHHFAESMDQMASEKKHIQQNEVYKKSQMPENLRQICKTLKDGQSMYN